MMGDLGRLVILFGIVPVVPVLLTLAGGIPCRDWVSGATFAR